MAILLFATLPAHRALIWSVLGAYLLLPVKTSFEFSGVPPLDKTSISNLSILIGCALFARERWLGAFKNPAIVGLAVLFVFSPFATSVFNPESFLYGDRFIPPMTLYDAASQAALNIITLIPFVAAYGLLNTDERRRRFLFALVLAALAYSVLMLIEVRLSPQLHRLIYGFFPHSFGQQMRGGGFRPVVFLGHGLLVAIFCAMALAAAAARWKDATGTRRTRSGLFAAYLALVLVLCKSLGAFVLAAVMVPAIAFLRARRLALLSAALCGMVLLYPAVRAAGLIPTATISEMTNAFSTDRGDSLGVRLINEDQLLQKAAQKPMFGWGSWGRNRIYDPETGKDDSITDGSWIIAFGTWGWAGYLSMFGLLSLGAVSLLWRRRALKAISVPSAALCALLTINLLDSVPNSSIVPLTWLIAGAVFAICGPSSGRRPRRALDPNPATVKGN